METLSAQIASRQRSCPPHRVESLESRALLSATPILVGHIDSTRPWATFTGSLLNGTAYDVRLKLGTADIYTVDNRLQLLVTNTGTKSKLLIEGIPELANISINGSLKWFEAPTSNLAGVLSVNGAIDKFDISSISGTAYTSAGFSDVQIGAITGTLATAGALGKVVIGATSGAKILSGVNLGANGVLGGGDDTYKPGAITSLTLQGPMINSVIAVGISPGADGIFGTADDTRSAVSPIGKLILDVGADPASRVEASSFGSVKSTVYGSNTRARKLANPTADYHFVIPAAITP